MSDTGRYVTGGYHFGLVPDWVWQHEGISDKAVRVYICLNRHGHDPTNCFPSDARIGRQIHSSKSAVKRARRCLVELHVVAVVPRFASDGRQISNGYHLAGDVPLDPSVYPVISDPPAADERGRGSDATPEGEQEEVLSGSHPQTTSSCGDSVESRNLHVADRAKAACDLIGDHDHAQAVAAGTVASPPAHLVACRLRAHRTYGDRAERLAYTYPELTEQQLAQRLQSPVLARYLDVANTLAETDDEDDDHESVSDLIALARSKLHGGNT